MKRRTAIQSLGMISAHALFPSILSGFITSCSNPAKESTYKPTFFSDDEFALMKEVIDIILPASQSQAASQVNTHHFLDEVFSKCLTTEQNSLIKKGIAQLATDWKEADDKVALLQDVDKKAYDNDETAAYFRAIKQYTLIGFFTSQEGSTKASNYVKIPGDYKGDIPLKPETLNYANTSLHF